MAGAESEAIVEDYSVKKISVRRPGGFGQLSLVECDEVSPRSDEILIRVIGAGVNFADCLARMGIYASSWHFNGWPLTPGFEVSGYVEAVGPDVTDLKPGASVIAVTRFGGYTEKLLLPRRQVFSWPTSRSLVEGAAFPVIFLTALYALELLADPPTGFPVLVHSAAGGVGSALVQLARLRGCHVVGVVGSKRKEEAALASGAHVVIDRSSGRWALAARKCSPGGYIAVFDANGSTISQSLDLLSARGRLVVYGAHNIVSNRGNLISLPSTLARYLLLPRINALQLTNDNKSVMGFNLSYLFHETGVLCKSMTRLLDLMASEDIRLPNIEFLPLAKAADAHRRLQSGDSIGKLVLMTQ